MESGVEWTFPFVRCGGWQGRFTTYRMPVGLHDSVRVLNSGKVQATYQLPRHFHQSVFLPRECQSRWIKGKWQRVVPFMQRMHEDVDECLLWNCMCRTGCCSKQRWRGGHRLSSLQRLACRSRCGGSSLASLSCFTLVSPAGPQLPAECA